MNKNSTTNLKSFIDEKKIGILLFALSIILLIITVSQVNRGLFIDESFSLLFTNSTYDYAIKATAADVHPPLYYIFLKLFRDLLSPFNIDPIIAGNLLSAIPIALLLIVSITKIKNEFGWIASGIFALCITSMPTFMYHTVSIRMYTFVMFFVTMEYLYAYSLVRDFSLKNWSIVTIFAILASYTHYYGILSSIIIYLLIFSFIIYKKKNQIKNIILSGIIILISYIPWIAVIINQFNYRKETIWWINNDFLVTFREIFWDYFSFSNGLPRLLGIILFLIVIFLILYQIKKYRQNKEIIFAYCGFIIPILTIILAIIISIIAMPIFVQRYVFVFMGCFWLGFSILLSKVYNNRKIFIPILIVLLCIASINTALYIESSNNAEIDVQMIDDLKINDVDVLISGDQFVQSIFKKWYAPLCKNYDYTKNEIDYNLIDKTINGNGNVYVLQRTANQNFDEIPSKYELELIKTLKGGHKDTLPKYIYKLSLK